MSMLYGLEPYVGQSRAGPKSLQTQVRPSRTARLSAASSTGSVSTVVTLRQAPPGQVQPLSAMSPTPCLAFRFL
eukprot:g53189.t1